MKVVNGVKEIVFVKEIGKNKRLALLYTVVMPRRLSYSQHRIYRFLTLIYY